MGQENHLGIYIHIPFCVRKCLYCDFLSAPVGEADREAYCEMLCKEITEKGKESAKYSVDTIFLGGGTPSLLSGKQARKIMDAVFSNFRVEKDAEISMEANPGTLSQKKLSDYLGAGVNRLSIGLQSAHNEELKALGRIHSYEDFLEGYEMAAQLGFSNLNVDLMLGIPGQTLQSYLETLRMVTHLPCKPAHISAYSLIVEEGTPFSRHVEQLPDEDTERYMYHLGTEYLKGRGYEQYEISNYARKGFESRHNCKYWKRENYLGLGLGASSMMENVRFKNTSVFRDYLAGDFKRKKEQVLSLPEQMEEFMFLGLRMREGVDEGRFEELFGKKLREVYAEPVQKYLKLGLLAEIKDLQKGSTRLTLTARGIDVSNTVMADFLLD